MQSVYSFLFWTYFILSCVVLFLWRCSFENLTAPFDTAVRTCMHSVVGGDITICKFGRFVRSTLPAEHLPTARRYWFQTINP